MTRYELPSTAVFEPLLINTAVGIINISVVIIIIIASLISQVVSEVNDSSQHTTPTV